MMIAEIRRGMVFILISVCIFFNFSSAQHFIRMTDEQRIELALDMVRKGVQQQDTTKVFMVVAPEVSIKGKALEPKANLSRKLQTIFANSRKRSNQLEKPSFPRADNPLHLSSFWDFDILDPKIKIEGDSAIVDCELVLWGAPLPPSEGSPTLKESDQRGRRTKERFIFKSPPKSEQPPPSGDGGSWPIDLSGNPAKGGIARPMSGKKQVSSIRSWQLIGFENLLDFLNEEIEGTQNQNKNKEGK